jgi:ribosome-associated protein
MAKTERRRKPAPFDSAHSRPEPRRRTRPPKSIELAVRAAEDKKAQDITVLDLRNAHGFTDYFVICSGANSRQIHAIADAVVDALAGAGQKPAHVEGRDRSEWVLVDYFDFIVHVFSPDTRAFYGLERLWGTAEHVDIETAR